MFLPLGHYWVNILIFSFLDPCFNFPCWDSSFMTLLPLKSKLLIKLQSVLLFWPLTWQTFCIFTMAFAKVCFLLLHGFIILILFSESWVNSLSFYVQGKDIMTTKEGHSLVGKWRFEVEKIPGICVAAASLCMSLMRSRNAIIAGDYIQPWYIHETVLHLWASAVSQQKELKYNNVRSYDAQESLWVPVLWLFLPLKGKKYDLIFPRCNVWCRRTLCPWTPTTQEASAAF